MKRVFLFVDKNKMAMLSKGGGICSQLSAPTPNLLEVLNQSLLDKTYMQKKGCTQEAISPFELSVKKLHNQSANNKQRL